MDFWDLESRVSQVTSGSRETLENLELIPLEQSSHGTYRVSTHRLVDIQQNQHGSLDVLGLQVPSMEFGLQVPSMELWGDERCDLNDGFGFCGGTTGSLTSKKWKDLDDSSSSGVHCEDADQQQAKAHHTRTVAPPSLTHVKSVDDYEVAQSGPKHRRYRKRTTHGRYATADDIVFDPNTSQVPASQKALRHTKGPPAFRRQTAMSRSLGHIATRADDCDKGSVTNLFVCGRPQAESDGASAGNDDNYNRQRGVDTVNAHHAAVNESPIDSRPGVMARSHSCQELSPRDKTIGFTVRDSVASTSQVLYGETESKEANANRKGSRSSHKRKSALFNTSAWLRKSQEFLARKDKTPTYESANDYVPDDPSDLKGMTNVKVIAIQSYKAQGAHELSFKEGQKLKLKAPSMDGNYAFGSKRGSRFSPKKYGYFPLSYVRLCEKQ